MSSFTGKDNPPDNADMFEIKVPCGFCAKEIPLTEAFNREAQDYVLFYCGTEFFNLWQKKADEVYNKNQNKN